MKDFNFGRPHPKKIRTKEENKISPKKLRDISERKDMIAMQRQMKGSK